MNKKESTILDWIKAWIISLTLSILFLGNLMLFFAGLCTWNNTCTFKRYNYVFPMDYVGCEIRHPSTSIFKYLFEEEVK